MGSTVIAARRTKVIELVGPAGVGKTTLRRLLANQHGLTPRGVWRLPSPLLFRSALRVLPASLALWLRAGAALAETKQIIRLEALFRLIERHDGSVPRAWLLDEGPVFVFSWLRAMGREAAGPRQFASWWRGEVARWRRTVDLIVMLDAPNELLTERIRTRAKRHLAQAMGDAETAAFLDRYRAAFNDTVADLTDGPGPHPAVMHVRTDTAPPEAIVNDLARCLNGRLHGH